MYWIDFANPDQPTVVSRLMKGITSNPLVVLEGYVYAFFTKAELHMMDKDTGDFIMLIDINVMPHSSCTSMLAVVKNKKKITAITASGSNLTHFEC